MLFYDMLEKQTKKEEISKLLEEKLFKKSDFRVFKLFCDSKKELPMQVKLFPVLRCSKENKGIVTNKYLWKTFQLENFINYLKIDSISFFKKEGLFYLRILKEDEEKTHVFVNGKDENTYFLRRVSSIQKAKEIFSNVNRFNLLTEMVVGYFSTKNKGAYIICKIPRAWTFDKEISLKNENLRYRDVLQMNEDDKILIGQSIIQTIKSIHKKEFLLNNFSIKNIFITKYDYLLGDLSGLCKFKESDKILALNEMKDILYELLNNNFIKEESIKEILSDYIEDKAKLQKEYEDKIQIKNKLENITIAI